MVTLPKADLPLTKPNTGGITLEWYTVLQRIAQNIVPEVFFLNQENGFWAVIKAKTASMSGNILQLLSFDNSGSTIAGLALHMNGIPDAAGLRFGALIFGAWDGTTPRNAAAVTSLSEAAWAAGTSQGANLRLETTAVGSATRTERMRITGSGNVLINTAAIATTATDGFLYVPTCAGVPTGVPTTQTGLAPIVIDSTDNRLYFYSTGAWRNAGP